MMMKKSGLWKQVQDEPHQDMSFIAVVSSINKQCNG